MMRDSAVGVLGRGTISILGSKNLTVRGHVPQADAQRFITLIPKPNKGPGT